MATDPKAYQNASLNILKSGGLWLFTALTRMFDTQRWANAIVNLNQQIPPGSSLPRTAARTIAKSPSV